MTRKLEGTICAEIYDTDAISLDEILSNVDTVCEWKGYYIIQPKSNDPYDNCLYFIDKQSKKIEWGMFITCIEVLEQAASVTPEEVKRALS